jgi:hypothetical protein
MRFRRSTGKAATLTSGQTAFEHRSLDGTRGANANEALLKITFPPTAPGEGHIRVYLGSLRGPKLIVGSYRRHGPRSWEYVLWSQIGEPAEGDKPESTGTLKQLHADLVERYERDGAWWGTTRDETPDAAPELRVLIHQHLKKYPGLTAREIARALGLTTHSGDGQSKVRRQLRLMEADGEAACETGPKTDSDPQPAQRWRAT